MRFLGPTVELFTAPRRAHARLAAAPNALGWGVVVLTGLAYAALFAALAAGGHAPSMTRGLPVAAADYYRVAALYVAPLLVVGAWIFGAVATRLAGVRPTAGLRVAYAAPILVLFVVPDAIALALAGHEALGQIVPVTGGLTVLAIWGHGALALKAAGGRRAVLAAAVGLFVQALVVAPLLR